MSTSLRHFLARIRKEERGSVLAYTALGISVLVGAAGLSVDIGLWYAQQRQVQTMADSAALAGAVEYLRTGSSGVYAAAERDAVLNGYNDDLTDPGHDSMTAVTPATSGAFMGTARSVEVNVSRPYNALLASVIMPNDNLTIRARSVAISSSNNTCIFALDPAANPGINVTGSATVQLSCGLLTNSTSASYAVEVDGSASVTATEVLAVGQIGGGGTITATQEEGIRPERDPFESMGAPTGYSAGTCDYGATGIHGASASTVNLDPGYYCGNIHITASNPAKDINFRPGTYIMEPNSRLIISGSANIVGNGVTFYWPAGTTSVQPVSITGGNINFVAPSSGEYAGILFFIDRSVTGVTVNITGGASMTLEGVIYNPEGTIDYSGGNAASAVMLLGADVDISGNSEIGNIESSVIMNNPNLVSAHLVE